MNVLQLISSGEGFYGAERVLVTLSVELAGMGARVLVGAFQNAAKTPHLEVLDVARRNGLPTERIRCRGRVDWQAVLVLRQLVAEHDIDIIHSHGPKANLYAYLAARNSRPGLVSTCHSWYFNSMIERGIGILDCVVLSRFDAVAVVSDAVGRRLRSSTLLGKIVTIDNGIKCAAFGMCEERTPQSRRASGSIVVGTVARLSREKGVRYLLDAAADVLAERPDTRFVIAGDGPDRGALLAQSERLGIDHRVSFLGAQSDMAHFYAGIDLFVLPSLTEGMPMALIEAMAAGKPVVATSVGSVPVIVEHLNDGVLVAPGDTAALAEALKLLLRRSNLRAAMGRRAQATAEARFSAESMALQYRRLYEAVNVAKMRPRAWANVGRA